MKKIVKMIFGSHMYGLDTPESDKDYKGIYLPELDDLLLQREEKVIKRSTGDDNSKNTKDDVDEDWMSLREFLRLATKGDTTAIDMLHSRPETWELDSRYGWIWEQLVSKRSAFYTKNLAAYLEYVRNQAAKYGIKGSRMKALKDAINAVAGQNPSDRLDDIWRLLPTSDNDWLRKYANEKGHHFWEVLGRSYQNTAKIDYVLERLVQQFDKYGARARLAENNEGIDWKAVSHALRAGYQLRRIYAQGGFEYPLWETDFLRKVKAGEKDFLTEVRPVLEALVEEVEELADNAVLPHTPNTEYWDQWLLDTYYSELIEELA